MSVRPASSGSGTLLMQTKFRQRLVALFVVIAMVLLAVGVIVYRSIVALIADTGQVTHTHTVIETLTRTQALLYDMQGSQRGYVITGQPQYLVPFHEALPLIEQNMERLEALTVDNPSQRSRLATLRSHVEARVRLSEKTVEARRTQGYEAAQRTVLSGEGKREMDAIRSRIDEIERAERQLLRQRSNKAQAAARFALGAGAVGAFIVVLIVGVILDLVRRESLRRLRVEARMEAANHRLQHSLEAMELLTREMTLTTSLAEMLQSCRSMDEAYDIIRKKLPQVLPDVIAELSLINASQNFVEVVVQVPANAELPHTMFAPDACWALRRGHLYLSQGPTTDVLCPHIEKPSGAFAGNAVSLPSPTLPRSTLCIPLMAHGEILGVLSFLSPQPDAFPEAAQRGAFSVAEHISLALANLKLQEKLRIQTIRDPLTGLFNRRYLEESLARELARATRHNHPLSVIMIDIDFFKRFNDSYGHEAGDLLLKEFGAFLQNCSRGEDVACRYGGEEFTLLLPDAPMEVARRRAEELLQGVAKLKIEYRRQSLPGITISAGVASFPVHATAKDELMRLADAALYRAKQEGRNRIMIAEAGTEPSTPLLTEAST